MSIIVNTKCFSYWVNEYQSTELGNQIGISSTQETKEKANENYILSVIIKT